MYHRLKRVDCPPLKKLNEIARLTVMFALEREDRRAEAKIKADFEAYFDGNDYSGVGEWLWRKRVIIRQPLLCLLAMSPAEKLSVKAAFEADIAFDACGCTGSMQTSVLDQEAPTVQFVKAMMIAFYESLLRDQKVPGKLVGELVDFDRQKFLRHFLQAQEIKVCPGCDGPPASVDLYAGKIREDVDHFLPKSKYPVLAIHPLNLAPLCKTCNQDYKGEHDAISDDDDSVSDVTTLEHIFHPYLRPACDEVDVTVSWCAAESKPKLAVKPRDDSPVGWARVHSLEYMLALESRWNGDLTEGRLEGPIRQGLMYSTQPERKNGSIEQMQIKAKFDTVRMTIGCSIGTIPGSVPAGAYAAWLADDKQAQDKRMGLWKQALNANRGPALASSTPSYF